MGCSRFLFGLGEGMGEAKCYVLMLLCQVCPGLVGILWDVGAAFSQECNTELWKSIQPSWNTHARAGSSSVSSGYPSKPAVRKPFTVASSLVANSFPVFWLSDLTPAAFQAKFQVFPPSLDFLLCLVLIPRGCNSSCLWVFPLDSSAIRVWCSISLGQLDFPEHKPAPNQLLQSPNFPVFIFLLLYLVSGDYRADSCFQEQ
ncbi:uncharacterized protein LOC113951212 [Corapipo altera]|uniref:uncharacterized protein LOC113951212 n=1 Tax=Corapipo altera TaxID=415028 RepID=UPI000FD65CB8|nr:uncharacterized protein LOC113951212 [Corapipo altera]